VLYKSNVPRGGVGGTPLDARWGLGGLEGPSSLFTRKSSPPWRSRKA